MADASKALDGILTLTALTPMHPGSGSGLGLIDNPVIRERCSSYPFIQAPSLKGVLRQKAREVWKTDADKPKITCIFGPERGGGSGDHYEGAVVFNDARILAMPVRSLKGSFVWITCPIALNRFFRDFSFCGGEIKITTAENQENVWNIPAWLNGLSRSFQCHIASGSTAGLLVDDKLYLEEFEIPATEKAEIGRISGFLAENIYPDNAYLKTMLTQNLVLLNDELFAYFIEHATQIEANIAIDQDSGTTVTGSLRYTEFLPAETIMSAAFRISERDFSGQKLDGQPMNPKKIFPELLEKVPQIQIGGDSTTGKGFVQLKPTKTSYMAPAA